MAARGVESILDTTFLSAYATPIAALTGMVIAFLVVRRQFSAAKTASTSSRTWAARCPGTILGIGFVLAFSTPADVRRGVLYVLLAFFLVRQGWAQADAVARYALAQSGADASAHGRARGGAGRSWKRGWSGLAQLMSYSGRAGAFYLIGVLCLLVASSCGSRPSPPKPGVRRWC